MPEEQGQKAKARSDACQKSSEGAKASKAIKASSAKICSRWQQQRENSLEATAAF
jgi:hypothetical protein